MAKKEETIMKKERHWMKQWNPEIAWVTFVGILVIVGTTAFTGMAVSGLKASLEAANTQGGTSNPPLATVQGNASACVFLCQANTRLNISLEAVGGATSCATAGKVKVYAFHSPTCPYCSAQEPVLEQLKQKYGSKLDISLACAPIHEGDDGLCQNNTGGKYLPYAQSTALLTQYQTSVQGTPTLIFDCEYARVGSYAIRDVATEYGDLDKVVSMLLES